MATVFLVLIAWEGKRNCGSCKFFSYPALQRTGGRRKGYGTWEGEEGIFTRGKFGEEDVVRYLLS